VETKFTPEAVAEATPPSRQIGLKAFYLEPWLILGSFVLWLTVLPFAGLLWSGATLLKRIETLPLMWHDKADGCEPTPAVPTQRIPASLSR
jgi:hypothetical protein